LFRFEKLRELIDRELGLAKADQIILDEKGVDVSTSHSEEIVNAEKKRSLVNNIIIS
jgi:hypothetical protein